MLNRGKTKLEAKRISYLLYSDRSLFVNKSSYIILFISIVCMIVMSSDLIIYNSSLSKAENDTVKAEYGSFHAMLEGTAVRDSDKVNSFSYIKNSDDVCVFCTIASPSTQRIAKLAKYSDDYDSLKIKLISGSLPGLDEVMVSEDISRNFSLLIGDKYTVNMMYGGNEKKVEFTVSGIYSACAKGVQYMFLSDETVGRIQDYDGYYEDCTYDKYITFKSDKKTKIYRYTDDLIETLGLSKTEYDEDGEVISSTSRNDFLNINVVNLKKFYEKSGFISTIAMSIIPAGVSILVFIVLDIYRSMRELSTLCMIGTTPKQFFGILLRKYALIYIIAFPVGLLISALSIAILGLIFSRINSGDVFYFSYSISLRAVIILFLLCFSILCLITYIVSTKTSTSTYLNSLSEAKNANSIFVRSTSNVIFKTTFRKLRLGLTFFARNRRVNLMFCSVTAVLCAVFSYFTLVITQQIGNTPYVEQLSDITVYVDTEYYPNVSSVPTSVSTQIASLDGVTSLYRSYSSSKLECDDVYAYIDGSKNVSKSSSTTSITGLRKFLTTKALVISEDCERAEFLYGDYLVSGSIDSIYSENSVAIFVHTWQNSDKYYQAGDYIPLKSPATDDTFLQVKIGAVFYDPFDEYENVNVLRVLTSADMFSFLCGENEPNSLAIISSTEDETQFTEVYNKINEICKNGGLICENTREQNRSEKSRVISSVAFYSVLWISVVFILILMLFSLTGFMLNSRRSTIGTLSMIGTSGKELFKIFGTEFTVCGIISSLFGLILSSVVIIIYNKLSSITYTKVIYNNIVNTIIICSVIFSSLCCILIPMLSALRYFKKEKYKNGI